MRHGPSSYSRRLKVLCLGRFTEVAEWIDDGSARWTGFCLAVIVAGCGLYGVSVGLWRSPLQSVFTGIKIPALILLTCAGNALLNGLLAQLLGTGLGFRQSSRLILLSFTVAACLFGALSPLCYFLLWNAPPLSGTASGTGHSVMLLSHVAIIAYVGLVSNYRLFTLLRHLAPPRAAAATLAAWLGGNLLLGTQLSWVLRPFIGSPILAVEFLRDDPLRGNFFEAVWSALSRLF